MQMSNDDGDWVLLNSESVERYCQRSVSHIEAWCMRTNKYLNNEQFLVPVNGKSESNAPSANEKSKNALAVHAIVPATPKCIAKET